MFIYLQIVSLNTFPVEFCSFISSIDVPVGAFEKSSISQDRSSSFPGLRLFVSIIIVNYSLVISLFGKTESNVNS